jgi:3-dehydrosphinganine reductase
VVWCIAGASYPKLYIETSTAMLKSQMDMNYWTSAFLAHATLKEWLAPNSQSKGSQKHLIFTSSVAAFYSLAGYAPYSPSKAALKSLSDTLAQEMLLYGEGVKIHTVFPGSIESPGLEQENLTKPTITRILEESDPIQSPEKVAAKSIAGLERGEYLVTVGFLGSAMRACAWGGSARNNWFLDTALTWILSAIWGVIAWDMDGKVRAYRKKNGHPSTYPKSAA